MNAFAALDQLRSSAGLSSIPLDREM